MASGRIRRRARRGIAAAVLGWLSIAAFPVLMAPSASAAPTATVEIRDVTPAVVSVDAGGSVTFVNRIKDKTVQADGGALLPSPVEVTATTEVTLGLPSGSKPLAPGASVTERFDSTCTTCTITYAYRVARGTSLAQALTDAALRALPPLPARTPLVVNTVLPDVPTPPSVDVPQLPTVTVHPPRDPGMGEPPVPADPANPADPNGTPSGPTPAGIPGEQHDDEFAGGTPDMAPGDAAAAATDRFRLAAPGEGSDGVGGSSGEGAGGRAGSDDGASVPVPDQLTGPAGDGVDAEAAADAGAAGPSAPALPAAALAAVLALAAVTAALVRTHQAQRDSR